MAEYNASDAQLVTPWGTIAFNGSGSPAYVHDASLCSGLDMAPIRATIDDKPVSDGGIWHRFFLAAREITLGGNLIFGAFTERNTLQDNLLAALESIRQDPAVTGTYQWTPTGKTLHSVTVRCDIPVVYTGLRGYQFGLVAADPTITIA